MISGPARLSDRLSTARIRELAALIIKSEHPHPTRALIDPLLELVSPVDEYRGCQIVSLSEIFDCKVRVLGL